MTVYFKDEELNVLDQKRIYLIDKINAYFKRVVEYNKNPIETKKQLVKSFNKQIEDGLKIFK